MSVSRKAIELFDTDATLHEIETYLWLHNNRLSICAESIRDKVLTRTAENRKIEQVKMLVGFPVDTEFVRANLGRGNPAVVAAYVFHAHMPPMLPPYTDYVGLSEQYIRLSRVWEGK